MPEEFAKLIQAKQTLISTIDKFPESQRLAVLFDTWNLKDIVAHLSNWMVHDIECLSALKEGKEPYWEPDVDGFNAKGIEIRKNKSWEEVYKEFIALGNNLLNIYETLPENLWEVPIWKTRKDQTARRFLKDDIWHWETEHLGDLQEKLQRAFTFSERR
jgi:hypothetical protein